MRGPGADPAGHRRALEEARARRERAERELAETSLAFRGEQERARFDLAALERVLPRGSVIVSYARYGRDPEPGDVMHVAPAYLAFVLRQGSSEIHVVPLGEASAIDSLAARWREQVSRGARVPVRHLRESEYRIAGEPLRRRIWDPVAGHFGADVRRVFIVPDAALHLVGFAALPAFRGGYLIESDPPIHYLSAERDLLPGSQEERPGDGLLALGGPDFARASTPALLAASAPSESHSGGAPFRGARSDCDEFREMRWQPLPGALRECEEVVSVWRAAAGVTAPADGGSAVAPMLFRGADATEAAFKSHAPGRRVLHLATHGFFVEDRCGAARPSGRGLDPSSTPVENPLLLTGLALAGANRRDAAGTDQEDGVLTAEEIAALDLSGVEWAVLSACETGVGEVRPGEGVFGLRRAFQIAGARSLIMSLWSVDDEATREWMRELYENRFSRRLGTAEAVHEATRGILESRRARSASTHPYFWGAFVAAGDWR